MLKMQDAQTCFGVNEVETDAAALEENSNTST
jgi:hypothetical protein